MSLGVAASLRIASMVGSFLLQSAFAWLACLITARIVQTHRARFRVWMAFLLVFVAQWARTTLMALSPAAAGGIPIPSYASPLHQSHRVSLMPWTARDISSLVAVVCCSYCAVVVVLFGREAASHLRLKQALQYRLAPPTSLQSAFDQLAISQRVKECSLWLLPGLSSPATLGWWRPQIVLPAICQSHAVEDVQAALWHELKHVQRRDALWNSLMRLCSIVLWFHPSVRYAAKAAVRERELACDADVVQDHPNGRDRYASCLLRFARSGASSEGSLDRSIGMTSGPGLLELRVRAILGEGTSEAGGRTAGRTVLAAVMCVAYVGAAPVLAVAFSLAEPFDLNRVTRLPPTSIVSPMAIRGRRLDSQQHFKGSAMPVASPLGAGVAIPAVSVPTDQALGAEHRAGLNVLNEFNSEMDSSVEENTAASTRSGQGTAPRLSAPRGTPKFSVPWTGMAIGAAQQLGSLSGGSEHDHD
jgi:beta-lactamase regulating signal transducer with metallopeptidase domain